MKYTFKYLQMFKNIMLNFNCINSISSFPLKINYSALSSVQNKLACCVMDFLALGYKNYLFLMNHNDDKSLRHALRIL